jgi:hypothetical protein
MAANVVLSFNQITFRTGLLLSLSGIIAGIAVEGYRREHTRAIISTRVGHALKKLYHVNDHKSANRVGIAVFSSGQLSLKRRQQRLGGICTKF